MPVKKSEFAFLSSNGKNTVRGVKYMPEDPKAVVVISHGMVEHLGRYDDFNTYLAENSYAAYIHTHIGHLGSTKFKEDLGYFAPKDGYKYVARDIKRTVERAKKENPGLKVILLGHSMGSFYARVYPSVYPGSIDGLIISGTGGPNDAAAAGLNLVKAMIRVRGDRYRSERVKNMMFGAYLKRIKDPRTPQDWISRDTEIVDRYVNDPGCTFSFTLGGYRDLLEIMILSNSKETYEKTARDLPILIFSGSEDPVGDYGMGVMEVFSTYKKHGFRNVNMKIYPGGRHEMLNEINRSEVYRDVLAWLNGNFSEVK